MFAWDVSPRRRRWPGQLFAAFILLGADMEVRRDDYWQAAKLRVPFPSRDGDDALLFVVTG